MKYECYIVRCPDGEVIYVGEGKKGRHKHVNSGTSHVYKINEYHFNKITLDVEVFHLPDKIESVFFEKLLIEKHKPRLNTEGTILKDYKVWVGRLLKEVDDRCATGEYKTFSVINILREAVKTDNSFIIEFLPKHMMVNKNYFSDTISSVNGNLLKFFFKHLSSMRHPSFLFIKQITPVEGRHSYQVELDPSVIQLEVKEVADILIKKVKHKINKEDKCK